MALNKDTVLLDSNYIIGILNGAILPDVLHFSHYVISAVTVMELYALSGISNEEESRIDEALRLLSIIPVTAPIAKRSGILARTHKSGKPDLLIAATALEFNLSVVTKNVRDFRKIPGLNVITANLAAIKI